MRHPILVGDDPARQTEPGWPAGRAVDDASHNGFSHRDTATAAIYLDDDLGIEGSLQNGRKILLPLAGPLDCRSAPAENACDRWASTPDRIVGDTGGRLTRPASRLRTTVSIRRPRRCAPGVACSLCPDYRLGFGRGLG